VRYGRQEEWKYQKSQGASKSWNFSSGSRGSAGLNGKTDSRPPDTSSSLLRAPKRTRTVSAPKYFAGCPWDNMSCWLDTSLQLFWVTAERDYESSLEPLFLTLPQTSFLSKLANSIRIRSSIDTTSGTAFFEGGCKLLRMQRDGLRRLLVESKQTTVKSMSSMEQMFVSTLQFSGSGPI
jgi:hypothetical protein